jgi:3-oxoacyl-[acyl-carrier protein] reductase
MKLKDKVALITGGGQGLGKSITEAMAKEGANIVICDINPDTLTRASKDIEALGRSCLGVRCDVSSVESVESMFSQAVERFGTVHILVNNAAIGATRPADTERRNRLYAAKSAGARNGSLRLTSTHTDEDWLRFRGVNVHGVFYCTRAALRLMEPLRYGKIINIASIAGMGTDSAFTPPYSATKAAVISMTKTIAYDVAGANIFVNCITCGGVLTPPMRKFLAEASEQERANLLSQIPLGRLGEPEEYAALAVHLASDENYCVGQTISPNGGILIWEPVRELNE